MATQTKNISVQKFIIVSSILVLLAASLYFLAVKNSNTQAKNKTQHKSITFLIPQGWIIYQENKNYDFDLGLFSTPSKKEDLQCRINTITANLDRNPSFEDFMGTTLGNKLFTNVHQEINYKDRNAWQGIYTFPATGLSDPVQNERILFKHNSIYVDITLSYSESLSQTKKEECINIFETYINQIQLL